MTPRDGDGLDHHPEIVGNHTATVCRSQFTRIFAADAIVRTGYQMGKTPLLPLFAAGLGAGDVLLGLIVSVSTLTGVLVKPIVGFLSDRQGRRYWLLLAGMLFTIMPFLYPLVETPTQLFALRLAHGLATAIFGPVSLALVAEIAINGRATRLGIFGMARSCGYLLAPVSAAFLLTKMTPGTLFMLTGVIAAVALVPLYFLPSRAITQDRRRPYFSTMVTHDFLADLRQAMRLPALWVAGGLEMLGNVAAYATKAFLPLYIIRNGDGDMALLMAGLFFTVQEAVHMLARPALGIAADRYGRVPLILCGLALMGVGVGTIPQLGGIYLLFAAGVIGAAQAAIGPASVAMIADVAGSSRAAGTAVSHHMSMLPIGCAMGVFGAFRNFGKILGPVLAGGGIALFGFDVLFAHAGIALTCCALCGIAGLVIYNNGVGWRKTISR